VYFIRTMALPEQPPRRNDRQSKHGHQFFSAISADAEFCTHCGGIAAMTPPIRRSPHGNDASGKGDRRVDVYATHVVRSRFRHGPLRSRVTAASTSPNFEQFSDRTVPLGRLSVGDIGWNQRLWRLDPIGAIP